MKKLFTLIAMISIASLSLQAQPWNENFEDGNIPAGWLNETVGSDDGFIVGSDLSSTYFPIPPHTIYIGTNDDECNCDKSEDRLITTQYGIPADEVYTLSFAYYVTTDGAGAETASVSISNDNGDTWTELTVLSPVADWTNVSYVLSDYSGDSIMVAFNYDDEGNWGWGLMLDDISSTPLEDISAIAQEIMAPEIYTTEDGAFEIAAYFTNNGIQEINSLQFHYQVDSETEVMEEITGLTIGTFETVLITSPTTYNASTLGNKNISVWATEINASAGTMSNEIESTVQFTDQSAIKVGLSETFTSNTCGPCAGFNPPYTSELTDLNTNVLGSDYVAVKYQVNWPSPGNDVCYNSDVLDRRNYYNVNAVPTTLVESQENDYEYAGPAVTWADAAENVALQFQDLTASQHGWVSIDASVLWDNTSDIAIDVALTPKANFDASTQTLHVAVLNKYYTASEINPDGTNGETEWEWVVRKMLPDGEGTTLGALTTGETENFSFDYTFTIGDVTQMSYNLVNSDVQVVAWVQDNDSKAIRNATLGDMSLGLDEIASLNDFNVFPNPTRDVAHITMNLTERNNVSLQVTDLLGKVVYAESMGQLQAGNHMIDVDAASIGNGMYLFNVYVGDQKVTKRVTISK
jgi:hypothetical protein